MTSLFLWAIVVTSSLVSAQQPQATLSRLQQGGLRFSIQDVPGLSQVAVHYSINKPIVGISAGEHARDINTKTGNEWVFADNTVAVKPGDTVNYWLHYVINGLGYDLLNQQWRVTEYIYTDPTTSTTTTTTTTTTPKPPVNVHTDKPIVNMPKTTMDNYQISLQQKNQTQSGTGTQSPDNTGTGTQSPDNTGTGSNTGTNTDTATDGSGTSLTSSSGCGCTGSSTKPPGSEKTCTTFPCMIFEDNFDSLNLDIWEHEITASGGGNWEFQYYTNNRSNSYVRDGKLYIKPTLTTDTFGPDSLTKGALDLWGSGPGDLCTGNLDWGCKRDGTPDHIINPIQSARLRSSRGFNFKYGKVEIRAKMPTGDWIWPAIWLLPLRNAYGKWPASGEIDIVEARGNRDYTDDKGQHIGIKNAGSTLHFGSDFWHNKWPSAHAEKLASSGTYGDSFHKYVLIWDEDHISISIDDTEILNVTPQQTMWEYGGNDQDKVENPWVTGNKMAPFDQEFFLIMNVAVGGTAFFSDTYHNAMGKPWSDTSDFAPRDFWNARNTWYPTWHTELNNGEDAAMQVDYIRVWKLKP